MTEENGIVIVSTIHGHGYGAETVLEHLIRGWPRERGKLVIVSPPGSRPAEAAEAASVPWVPFRTRRDAMVENFRVLRRTLAHIEGCALVHAWHARGFELAWWLGRRLRVPATGTLHDHPRAAFYGPLRRGLMKAAASHLSRLACVSQAVLDACVGAGYRCPLQVVHNGLNPLAVTRQPSDVVRVGFLGMYAEWKGFGIVESWVAKSRHLPVKWMLYGNVSGTLSERAEQLRLVHPQAVILGGWRPLPEILKEIDLVVVPSLDFEPFSTVVIEAASAGIPAVASRTGGMAEIVAHGESGFLFDPALPETGWDYLERLLRDPALRERMSEQAHRRYEDLFRISSMVEAYAGFWEEARSDARRPACRA